MKHASDYFNQAEFEPFECTGGCNPIEIVPQLKGKKWDDLALGILHAFNPTCIRVTTGSIKCDSRLGRITVYVTEDNVIENIEQEVRIGIPGDSDAEIDRNHDLIHDLIHDILLWEPVDYD